MQQLSPAEQESVYVDTPKGRLVRKTICVGALQTNATIIGNLETKAALVIDPGDEAQRIVETAEKLGLKVKEIYHTHGHFDHIAGSEQLKSITKAITCIHSADLFWWQNLEKQVRAFGITSPLKNPSHPDRVLGTADATTAVNLEGIEGICLHTPGHTQGSTSYHFPAMNVVCTGDTLFRLNIGRTDLVDGSFELIEKSIRNILYKLPKDTKVIPGHGGMTSIGFEKSFNTFFQENDDDDGSVTPAKTSAFDRHNHTGRYVGFCVHGHEAGSSSCSSHL